ncbi:leucine-rich repeat-containing protein 25 isoform X2 [Phyllobates terribilis]|uniref:leucine-rich repeat-containing protein 25 isoform X2 n=1 Tax=Phyllobates terribilis TaxID=111132 RepID=UPI003CCB264D
MCAAFMLMIFLYMAVNTKGASHQCNNIDGTTLIWSNFNNCSDVILKNKSINEIVINDQSYYGSVSKLDLSHNKIKVLPGGFLSNAIILKEVHLQNNNLEDLPEKFLKNSSKLQVLNLEGNQLSTIPASIFHDTLYNLTVDCQCNLVKDINNASKYPKLNAICKLSSGWTNPQDFYEENCRKQYMALFIVLPILVIALIAGGVALYMWKRKTSSSSLESKSAADMSPVHGQPRYMSTNMEGSATMVNPGQKQDYENVFVGYLPTTETKPYGYGKNELKPGTHSKHAAEGKIQLESDDNEADQPIYTNTQGIYYNYSEPRLMKSKGKEEEEDVYILPDQ